MSQIETATFGAGCFWGVEEVFKHQAGVTDTACGYTGGESGNATYKQVCTGATGHAEVVQLHFDPTLISYTKLLELFFRLHDPTTLNRQGPDVGTQYRSAIFYHNEQQHQEALAFIDKLTKAKIFPKPIVTQLTPLEPFFRAEEYHQKYFEKNGGHSCHMLQPPFKL